MKKKLLNIFTALCLSLFLISSAVNAAITSEADVTYKLNQVQSIVNYDFNSMVNKNELIGEIRSSFDMSTMQYKNNAGITAESLRNILRQIDIVKNSADFSDSDKNLQISKLYQDADSALYQPVPLVWLSVVLRRKTEVPSLRGAFICGGLSLCL